MSTRFNFGSILLASIIATIAMTIVMAIFGINLMKILGFAAGMSGGAAYLFGGVLHFAIGIFYGIIYALFFEPWMKKMPGFLSGALYSLLPFIIALIFIGPTLKLISFVFDGTSCAPCQAASSCAAYSCYPCEPDAAGNSGCSKWRDCEPYVAAHAPMYDRTPDHDCMPRHKCMPDQSHMTGMQSAPCGSGSSMGWFLNLINHLVYGAILGLVYRPRIIEETKE